MSIPAYATIDGTRRYNEKYRGRYAAEAYRQLGKTGLWTSRVGFGTYRCHHEVQQHHQALVLALNSGCNLLDTSANYTDGNAEVLLGDVFNREMVWGDLTREEIVVVSKVGYIQGENMRIALDREAAGEAFPEVIKYQPGLWHCIHPEFIEDQITRSLARMHLDVLDVYLLHNPEYFLSHARLQQMDRESAEKAFYERIRRAFIRMEQLADEGLIRHYGISSNGFPSGEDAAEYVSLAKIWKAYEDACLQRGISAQVGHFAVIQLPFNWLEHQAATRPNNLFRGERQTVLALANMLGLGVLVNRPLNAIRGNQLVRLSSQNQGQISPLEARFDAAYPSLAGELSFSQKALLTAATAPVDVVLNGMRTPAYVEDSLGMMTVREQINLEEVI